MQSYEDLYKSKRISIPLKVRIFQHTLLVYFYTCTIRNFRQKQIDAFQRKLQRRVINIRWPKVITNEKLNELTGAIN